MTVELTDLVGSWEAAHGTAPWGGDGLVALSNLAIDAEGWYTWADTVGGVIDGTASAGSSATSGTLAVSGQTMTFTSGDGSVIACTFLPVAGDPLEAFSLDAGMFTRGSWG